MRRSLVNFEFSQVNATAIVLSLGLLAATGSAEAQQAPTWITVDSFEDAPSPPPSFRFQTLALRDPHLFALVPTPFGTQCLDITDPIALLPALPSLNGQIAAALTADTDNDGFIDSSPMLWFRPLATPGFGLRVDSGGARCTFPVAGTSCEPLPMPAPEPGVFYYLTQASGTCLQALAGTIGSPPYNPAILAATASAGQSCFVTGPQNFAVAGIGPGIPLSDAQFAGRFGAQPIAAVSNGLLRGFLTEAQASLIQVPLPNPPGGVVTLANLLPGGTDNCSPRNDKDILRGESGWWFYFNYSANLVPFSGS